MNRIESEDKRKTGTAVRAVLLFTLLLPFLAGGCAGIKALDSIELRPPDLTRVNDGVWKGEWNTALVSAETAVTVTGHRIVSVEILRHDCGLGRPAEAITGSVVKAQSLDVDMVSGATGSSRVILKSVEQALWAGAGGAPAE